MIRRRGSKWILFTKDGSRVLGRHDTYDEALGQERAIHARRRRNPETLACPHCGAGNVLRRGSCWRCRNALRVGSASPLQGLTLRNGPDQDRRDQARRAAAGDLEAAKSLLETLAAGSGSVLEAAIDLRADLEAASGLRESELVGREVYLVCVDSPGGDDFFLHVTRQGAYDEVVVVLRHALNAMSAVPEFLESVAAALAEGDGEAALSAWRDVISDVGGDAVNDFYVSVHPLRLGR